jgi:hypothetical protein
MWLIIIFLEINLRVIFIALLFLSFWGIFSLASCCSQKGVFIGGSSRVGFTYCFI